MNTHLSDTLEERQSKILVAVVCNYISTAEPVGSRTIAKKYGFGVSPATIRNIMSDLEDLGFLVQPHTSAGRIPTDKGFRFYVDQLDQSGRALTENFSWNIEEMLHTETDLVTLLKKTTDLLSRFSNQAGLVLAPYLKHTICRHIDFIKLNHAQVMVIFISDSGLVHKRVISLDETFSQDVLDKMSKLITGELMGLTLIAIRAKLLKMIETEKAQFDALLTRALQLSQQFFADSVDEGELYVGGTFNMMSQPEFTDIERVRYLVKAFEEKRLLIHILDQCIEHEDEGVKVLIGEENMVDDMRDVSFVLSSYKDGERALGVVGIIGPKRMDYTQVIPLVEYTAQTISRLFRERGDV